MLRLCYPLVALLVVGCASSPRRFTRTTVLWEDDDRHPFSPRPPERYVPLMWDAADNMLLRPAARFFAFETHGDAIDVNAVDEVPDSSWFENRIGRRSMSADEVALGACDPDEPMPRRPWTVVEGKPDGRGSGFVFEDALGRRFVLKADREAQPEQATAADAIGAAFYHAAGYYVPCNRVVLFEESWLELAGDARVEQTHGEDRAMTEEDLRGALEALGRHADGRLRGLASLYLDGTPLGPWDYRGTWGPDLNDVIDHQQRRELRGMFVLNAWIDHWDARQHNTLATWIEAERGGGYVRHNLVDFGDTLGYVQGHPRRARRYGHSEWFDTQHILEDFLTFGIPTRPWDVAERGPTWPMLGYLDVETFDPGRWRPNYFNGAFEARDAHDEAWMARIIARFDRAHVRAAAELGRWSDPAVPERLTEVLMGRRAKILERYLDRLSPLTRPRREGGELCLDDLAVSSGLREAAGRRYRAALWREDRWETVPSRADGARVCAEAPDGETYARLRVVAATPGERVSAPAEVHSNEGQVVGLLRPDEEMSL